MTPTCATATSDVTLRPATDADREFLVDVYGSTRDEELSQIEWAPGHREAFVRMQFDAQDADYRKHNPDGAFDVIEVDGRPAGRLYVDRRPGDIRIVDIALLPEFRGRRASADGSSPQLDGRGRGLGPQAEHPRGDPQPGRRAVRQAGLRRRRRARHLSTDGVGGRTPRPGAQAKTAS